MPAERLRLRAWIEQQADSGRLPGLEWEDREKGIFKVSWKHASRQCWSYPKDACVFEGWAIHSGRYRKGYDKPDPRRWKANFRCALNALPDIRELANQGIARGQDAYKVYQILKKSSKKDSHHKRQSKCKYLTRFRARHHNNLVHSLSLNICSRINRIVNSAYWINF